MVFQFQLSISNHGQYLLALLVPEFHIHPSLSSVFARGGGGGLIEGARRKLVPLELLSVIIVRSP